MSKKSAFQKRLDAKLRAGRKKSAAPRAATSPATESVVIDMTPAGDIHPNRYPDHDANPLKGQVYKGECNRTACRNSNAIWWNIHTYGLYCQSCGPRMNFSDSVICAPVTQKPTLSEMNDPDFRRGIQKRALNMVSPTFS